MSEFKVNTITNEDGSYGPQVCGITTFGSSGIKLPSGPTEFRGGRGKGLIAGGNGASDSNMEEIDVINIASLGNSQSFGNLTEGRRDAGAVSSSTRAVFAAGGYPSPTTTMDYTIFSSGGGANDFGEYAISLFQPAGASNNVRGIFAGGVKPSPTLGYVEIEFITIPTTGNSDNFGSLSSDRWAAAGVTNGIRAIFGGGNGLITSLTNLIEFVTISTLGDAQTFGNLSATNRNLMGASNNTRGIFAGGRTSPSSPYSFVNTIEYITMSTSGNTTDFGDLTLIKVRGAGISSSVRAVFAGGEGDSPFPRLNTIDFVTISSTGNAADFGDLAGASDDTRSSAPGASDVHGGLTE
tara:strand:+ start:51 stop:1106 length:1056 start_codon:yes stop_codon:yes gene_type:complete